MTKAKGKTEVATAEEPQLPAEFLDEVSETGLGYSEDSADSLIPILGVLQDNSGEVKKKHERYIEGAEAGDLIMRSLQKIWKTEDGAGLLFQPCGFDRAWVEWSGEPGEGAPVGQREFTETPEGAELREDPQNPERKIWLTEDGNRLVDTRYHFGHVIGDEELIPTVIPMSGTNHTSSRQWTSLMRRFRVPGRPNQKAPSFFRQYLITTSYNQRGQQSWYKYKITDRGFIANEHILREGLALLRSVEQNEVTADVKDAEEAPVNGDDIPV